MPDLGQKHECFRCGTKFYDLKKVPVLCPKCHADQKEAPPTPTSPVMLHAARRAKRDEFADPDLFDRNRDEEDISMEGGGGEEVAARGMEDEELPLGESPSLEGPESDSEDEY